MGLQNSTIELTQLHLIIDSCVLWYGFLEYDIFFLNVGAVEMRDQCVDICDKQLIWFSFHQLCQAGAQMLP